jgi:hypothetical protein
MAVEISRNHAAPDVNSGNRDLLLTLGLQQLGNAITELGAAGAPEIGALRIDSDFLLATGRDRIEETNALDVATVPPVAAVGNHDMVKGTLFGAAA